MMVFWKFVEFCKDGGTNVFRTWYQAQHCNVQAACKWAIHETAITEDLETYSPYKILKRKDVGLGEIKFEADDKAGTGVRKFRALGFWNYDRSDFILVSGGRKPIPQVTFDNVLDIQLRYFLYGEGYLDEHRLF
jgi:hypothetical protein